MMQNEMGLIIITDRGYGFISEQLVQVETRL